MKNMTEVSKSTGKPLTKSEKQGLKAGGRKTATNGRTSASDLRAELLDMGADVVRDVVRQARGEMYDMTVDQGVRDDIFKSILPMLHAAGDHVDLGDLASLDPVGRANRILEAVAMGSMSPKAAMELINLMKGMADLDGSNVSDEDVGGKLIINLANIPDKTLVNEVREAIPRVASKIG